MASKRNLRSRGAISGKSSDDVKENSHLSAGKLLCHKENQLGNLNTKIQHDSKNTKRFTHLETMANKRNLRSRRVILGKSDDDVKENDHLSTGKLLRDKENQLVNLNTKMQQGSKDTKRCKSHQSTLTNMKTWPLTNILNEKNGDIICNKIIVTAQRKEKQPKQCSKKEIKNVKKKTTAKLQVNKQKHNLEVIETDENDIQSKEGKESVVKMKMISCKFNKENLKIVKKGTKTERSCKNEVTNIPIWRKYLDVNKSSQSKKRRSNVDVYDMSQDEELMSDETEAKKKRILCQRNNANNNGGKKKCHPLLFEKKILPKNNKSSKPVDKKTLKSNQATVSTIKLAAVTIDKQAVIEALPLDQNTDNNNMACIFLNENNMSDTVTTFAEDGAVEIIETGSNLVSSEPKLQTVTNWADELEKSFLMPKMTSTPDTIHLKTMIPNKKHKVVTNISNITTINNNQLNTTITTPDSTCNNNVERETDEDIRDVTLFESPLKKDENKTNKLARPKKTIQINLFGEIIHSPTSEDSLEDSVLIPHKAYHTPDNFKTHLARTKRAAENLKKEPKKSKQEMLCEKLTQHFDEIEDTELYIE